jgi:carbon storage regulator
MLVLSRKIGESIICNENIEIKVIKIAGQGVKIGINAPTGVRILREEKLVEALAGSFEFQFPNQ